jgi:hypothetical protein
MTIGLVSASHQRGAMLARAASYSTQPAPGAHRNTSGSAARRSVAATATTSRERHRRAVALPTLPSRCARCAPAASRPPARSAQQWSVSAIITVRVTPASATTHGCGTAYGGDNGWGRQMHSASGSSAANEPPAIPSWRR